MFLSMHEADAIKDAIVKLRMNPLTAKEIYFGSM